MTPDDWKYLIQLIPILAGAACSIIAAVKGMQNGSRISDIHSAVTIPAEKESAP